MDNMISWNWPNWITVVLMAILGYLALSFVSQIIRSRMGMKGIPGGRVTGAGDGPSQSQANFAGVYGADMFAMPDVGALTSSF